jgi:hypothetical protein
VSAFTRPDLFNAAPSKQIKVGSDVGAVVSGQVVEWSLATNTVAAGQPAYFGIFPLSTNGIDYDNAKQPAPPQLIVDYQ